MSIRWRGVWPWASIITLVALAGGAAIWSTEFRTKAAVSPPIPLSTTPPVGWQHKVSARLVVPSPTLVAGSTVTVNVVVTNHSRNPVSLPAKCGWQMAVGLQSTAIPFNPVFPADLCVGPPYKLRSGVTRLPFKVPVTYQACTTVPQDATPTAPACLPGNRLPPLPAGQYEVVLVGRPFHAQPVPVTVVSP